MRKITVLLAFGLLIACATEQASTYEEDNATRSSTANAKKTIPIDNDWSKKNLKGAVKERTVWVYSPSATGEIDKKALLGGVEVVYNEAGNKVTWKSYDEKKQLLDAWEYHYNTAGNLKERKTINGPVTRLFMYRYNKEQQLEQSIEQTNGSLVKTTNYQYDDKGQLVTSVSLFDESDNENKRQQRYNSKGQLIELQVFDENEVLQLKKRYAYDEQGREVEQAIYSGSNIPSYKRKFVYDEQGNYAKDWAYLEDGTLNERDAFTYQYTYDKQGNWLTMTKTNQSGQPLEYSTQTLVYFKK